MSVKYFFPLAILFLLFSCKQDEKKVEPQQSHVESSSTTYVKLKKYIDSSYLSPSEVEDSSYTNGQIYDDAVSLAKEMKGDTSVPELLFRTGALVKGRKGPTKAIGIWGLITSDYNTSKWAPEAAFQKAFTFDNDLHDKETAKKYYQEFLDHYPKHKMAGDVKLLMATLNKTDAQLIEEFERKNNIKR
ncbi:MAG TPA: hypothetical protein PKY97_00090 [Saprospiraceae bacterium]|jgi:hypothetical protein|nr:hypothetical protein [Saprospiraceae bacterium]MCO5277496.1 hypothetical protein [Saprospiraceae bacterium]HRG42821.1 hypothetical protein [Saprospiraceae bacterium]